MRIPGIAAKINYWICLTNGHQWKTIPTLGEDRCYRCGLTRENLDALGHGYLLREDVRDLQRRREEKGEDSCK